MIFRWKYGKRRGSPIPFLVRQGDKWVAVYDRAHNLINKIKRKGRKRKEKKGDEEGGR